MDSSEFWASIDAAPANRYVSTYEIDWGSRQRGQGRRRGHMIMGAMSDAPRGRKSYADILGKAPLTDDERSEAKLLSAHQQAMIARVLAAGYSTTVAFLVAYSDRESAYDFVQGHLPG